MSHTMVNAQTYIRESHTGNILSHSHTVATFRVLRIVHCDRQILVNHLDSLKLEHVAHLPCCLGNQALDGVSHRIHTGSSSETLWQRVHQLSIYDSYGRNIVRIHANHLLLACLVDDYIVDGSLGSSTCCGRKRYDRQALVLGRSHALQGNDVGELWVCYHHADALGCIHRATTTNGDDEISLSLLACLNTGCNVRNGWVWLHVVENLVSNVSLVQNVEHHLGYTELHQALICYNQSFLPATASYYCREFFTGTWAEIRHFIENESVYHKCFC